MTGTITRTPCPQCKIVGGLNIEIKFVAEPFGSWSLAGAQTKTTGQTLPVLQCDNCDFDLVGRFDGERHAVFAHHQDQQGKQREVQKEVHHRGH